MQTSSKLLFQVLLILMGLLLAGSMFVALSSSQRADALSLSERETVRSALDSYIISQFAYGAEGEAGFLIDQAALKARIDSNNDGIYLGEGDDAANAPVLVDVLESFSSWIPGTAVRGQWNTTSLTQAKVDAVKDEVNQHVAAGFSTDVVVYCATGHTESVVAGGYGAIAQTGGLGKAAYPSAPKVLAFKWGRNGWQDIGKLYTNTFPIGAAGPKSAFADATQFNCTGDPDPVRCAAEWAAGNMGTGVNPPLGYVQPVDIRAPSPAGTLNNTAGGNPATIQIPINTLFNTGLNNLNPAGPKKIFAGRTQHLAGIAAVGAKMLGYDSSFLQWGMPNWNNTMEEKKVSTGKSYPLESTPIDLTGPTQTGVGHANVTSDHAEIFRTTNEPATMKIEYGTTPGMYTNWVNSTVLKSGTRTEHLTGLTPCTTYYYRVTSYDGMANPSASAEGSFTTSGFCGEEPPVVIYTGPTGITSDNSPTITGTATDNVGVTSAHLNLNGGPNISCTVTPSGGSPVSIDCPTSSLADGPYSAEIQAHDAAGNSGIATGSFTVDTCTPAKPALSMAFGHAYWASYAEYTARNLTVRFVMSNAGSDTAYSVAITGATATNGVTLNTPTPAAVGDIAAGASADVYLKYHVPTGVTGFRTNVTASASDACDVDYTYP